MRVQCPPNRQQGLATIVISLMLLFGIAVVTLYANRVAIFDLRMANNQYHGGKAFQAAEAGLEYATAMLQDAAWRSANLTSTSTPDTVLYTLAAAQAVGGVADQTFTYAITQLGTDDSVLRIDSTGCSESCANGSATVSQVLYFKSALAGVPSAPLTAKGNIQTGGNADIINTDESTNGLTVHAGGGNVQVGSATLTTVSGTPPEASVVKDDTTLSSLSDDQFFMEFFGDTKENVKNSAYQVTCSGVCNTELSGQTGKVIYVTGDTDITSNLTIGSSTAPVILIVDGTLHISGNVEIWGILYCTAIVWDNTGMGTVNVHGSAVAEGDFTGTGTPTITYDTDVMNNLHDALGTYAKVLGTWRDY